MKVFCFIFSITLICTTNLSYAQDTSTVLESKLSIDIGMTHNFNFKPTYFPYIPGLMYQGSFTETYHWQPSLELLYDFYLLQNKKNYLRHFSFSTGLKLNHERRNWVYDTTGTSSIIVGSYYKVDVIEKINILQILLYINYKIGAFTVRAGIVPSLYYSLETDTYLHNPPHKNTSWNLSLNLIVFRMDYALRLFKKSNPYFFCFYNGFGTNEFGGGIGIPLTYYK